MLKHDGHLRPAVEAAFASMVMYFEARALAGEVPSLLATMCSKLSEAGLVQTDAASTFCSWGTAIAAQFAADNLHLTARAGDTGTMQLVATVQSLGRTVGGLHAQMASMQRGIIAVQQAQAAAPTPAPSPAGGSRLATPKGPSRPASRPATEQAEQAEPTPTTPPPPSGLAGLGGLLPSCNEKAPTITEKKAHEIFQICMGNGGALPVFDKKQKQQKPKAELLMKWFNAMATAEEKVILKPPAPATAGEPAQKPDDGKRRAICIYLNRLIVERLIQAYEEASTTVPRDFKKEGYMLPASGIATHAEASLKKAGCVPETSMFASWRTQHEQAVLEEKQAGGAGPSGAPPKKKPRKK